jgi:ubiquinol-cytochrome c reductase cytochrome b subunit
LRHHRQSETRCPYFFFTAAYRRPKEINWLTGLTPLVPAIVTGFLGYSLLDDLICRVGLKIGYAILLSALVIGPSPAFIALGGMAPSAEMIPRLYSLHIFLVPSLISVLPALHLGIDWRQFHTNYLGPRRTDRCIVGVRLWPSYAAKSVGPYFLVFAVVSTLGGLVQIDPIWIYGPFNPTSALPGAQPDWCLGWVEGAMRLFPGVNIRAGSLRVPKVFFSRGLVSHTAISHPVRLPLSGTPVLLRK